MLVLISSNEEMAFNDLTVQLALILADTEEEGAQSFDLFKYICFCLTIFAGKKNTNFD